tara:strand:- start:1230 stop:2339 length:1110 start_codon:yes stop_codon:yes gene_type:complete
VPTKYAAPTRRIGWLADGDPPLADFPPGVVAYLRFSPMTEEVRAWGRTVEDETLRYLVSLEAAWMPSIAAVKNGVTSPQRKKHLYLLHDIVEVLRSKEFALDPKTATLVPTLLRALETLRVERGWRAVTTLLNYALTLYGTMERLDQYTATPRGMYLKERQYGSMWKDAMTAYSKKAIAYTPKVFEAHPEIVKQVQQELAGAPLMVLMIDWLHAARHKNALELDVQDITFLDNGEWKIQWSHAKTSHRVGTYYTFSAISPEQQRMMQAYIQQRLAEDPGESTPLVPATKRSSATSQVIKALKSHDPKLSLHTLRRGSLSAMAKNGTDMETLMVFSGHSNVATLLKYIQRGSYCKDRRVKGAAAARSALL